ncbi:MAG: hypothetical protein ACYS5F_15285 [Planctomycetota bacterium]|jgi:hypothetical protein
MLIPDSFSAHYQEILEDTYDCVDRIVLNAYFSLGHNAGGFRNWWRELRGSDTDLTNTFLIRMAGRFSRRLRAYAKAHDIPLIDCKQKERKDEIAKTYIPQDPNFVGLFLIVVNRAPGVVWHIQRGEDGGISHIVRKKPLPYINHYCFHIIDPDWGHIIIRMGGHPPFPAQIIFNGHEYVARQADKAGIGFRKEDNCFTEIDDARHLSLVADAWCSENIIGRLRQVCERWIYSSCLCFALSFDEQQRSGFHYNYSVYQAEYSRNLIFGRGKWMDQVFESVIDRTRRLLNIRTVKTIFGSKKRPAHSRLSGRQERYQVTVERPAYNLTIFKVHYGKLTVKMYSKGERVLRIEVVAHNCKTLRCGIGLEKFPRIVETVKEILERFLSVLQSVDVSFITSETLQNWLLPSKVGAVRVGGIDANRPRIQAVMQALISLAATPGGFTASQLAESVRDIMEISPEQYHARQASYDLKKFRGKQLVSRIGKSHRYQTTSEGVKTMAAFLLLQQKVLTPLIDNAGKLPKGPDKRLSRTALQNYSSGNETYF